MSAETCTLTWGVTISDSDRWTAEQRERYDDQDAVFSDLRAAMEAAGHEFMARRPEIFPLETLT